MFTGIVRERGRVVAAGAVGAGGGRALTIAHTEAIGAELAVGASVAVSGVCVTAIETTADRTEVELSSETLARSTLGELAVGDEVNLEPPLRAGDPLGGHLVQGHVDATAEVVGVESDGEHRRVTVRIPEGLRPYVVEKGSVALDGVSLTVATIAAGEVTVALVPETLRTTTLGDVEEGDRLNLEVDILGKYVERALAASGQLGL